MTYFTADSLSMLSYIIRTAGPMAYVQVCIVRGVFPGFVTGIHKDLVHKWNLQFPSAGVFAEVLAGRATWMQITFWAAATQDSRLHTRHVVTSVS